MKQTRLREKTAIGLIGLALVVAGCQSSLQTRSTDLDNTRFMSLWQTYTDCRVSADLAQASSGMEKLSAATQIQDEADGFVLPLPTPLEQFVTNPPNRLAVDVRAMTAACSLHTGQLALHQGRIDMARDVFSSVLALRYEVSPYYLMQAKRYLTELEQGLDLALSTP